MDHKRIVKSLVVVVAIVAVIVVLMAAGPSLMSAIIAMHSR